MKVFKRIIFSILGITGLLGIAVWVFMQQKIFGKNPDSNRQERWSGSPNFVDGEFKNAYPTVVMNPDVSFFTIMRLQLNKPDNTEPSAALPSVKTDLHALDDSSPTVIWFGHSSYLIKYKGKNLLIDPVLTENASPVRFFGRSFPGSNIYSPGDIGDVDIVFITHDHYDHLDYETIVALHERTKLFVTAPGVGSHLEYWGVPEEKIVELDWWESYQPEQDMEITATPARHFSGRTFERFKTFWCSFVLKWDGYKLFLGGDSGYDANFEKIGQKFGPFDLAVLEMGQYGEHWPLIHMVPEQAVQAAKDLNAEVLFPVHWGRFALAFHAWNEPAERVTKAATEHEVKLTMPKIGQPIVVGKEYPCERWWGTVSSEQLSVISEQFQ